MNNLTCSSLKDSLISYLAAQTVVHESGTDCVVTVPMNTIDNRWLDITIEERGPNFFLVHDGGKSADELFLQGVLVSDKKTDVMKSIAERYGVEVSDGRFMAPCKGELLQHSIWAVAHCSGLAMADLLRHKPNVEEEAVRAAVGGIVTAWGLENHARIQRSLSVRGETGQHTFDFIAAKGNKTVAVNVLNPGSSSLARAQRYGFQGFDTRNAYKSYEKMAVLANPRIWSDEAKRIVNQFASKTVEFATPYASSGLIVESLDALTRAA